MANATIAVDVTNQTVSLTPSATPTVDVSISPSVGVSIDLVGMPGPAGPPGTTDHGALIGLSDDDHPQYLTTARGDLRYATIEPVILDFATPQSTWAIDIGRTANITVIDSAGNVVEPGSIHYNGTSITLEFSAAFSGKAYCF